MLAPDRHPLCAHYQQGESWLFVSVVVPCYRSAATLQTLSSGINETLSGSVTAFEIILVVDGGDHATWVAARDLQRLRRHVRAIRLSRNFGQHNALIAGVRAARYDVIVTMDDDLQHRPDEIPILLAALTDDVDLVYGVPAREEHRAVRSLASRCVKASMERMIGVRNARQISAFRAFRTFLRDGFTQLNGPHACLDVALSWGTTQVTAVTVRMDDRTCGRSGYTVRLLMRHALNMVLGYSTAPLRLVTYLGLLVGVGGVVLFGRLLYLYLSGRTTIAGFTTIASMVALFSAAQMVAIGVLGEYVGRIHAGGLGRPTYVVRADSRLAPPATIPSPAVPSGAGVLVGTELAEGVLTNDGDQLRRQR
jgi:glycosyltransferase involved in cell wall biosynthesis